MHMTYLRLYKIKKYSNKLFVNLRFFFFCKTPYHVKTKQSTRDGGIIYNRKLDQFNKPIDML